MSVPNTGVQKMSHTASFKMLTPQTVGCTGVILELERAPKLSTSLLLVSLYKLQRITIKFNRKKAFKPFNNSHI